jgi:hypothetical protein
MAVALDEAIHNIHKLRHPIADSLNELRRTAGFPELGFEPDSLFNMVRIDSVSAMKCIK